MYRHTAHHVSIDLKNTVIPNRRRNFGPRPLHQLLSRYRTPDQSHNRPHILLQRFPNLRVLVRIHHRPYTLARK